MSWIGAPGPKEFDPRRNALYLEILEEVSNRYDVDKEEILVGYSSFPPSDPTCLVYVHLGASFMCEYFRKGIEPTGRWICRNYMREEVTDNPLLKGTYDIRKNIQYRT